jgi:hypothetical protein
MIIVLLDNNEKFGLIYASSIGGQVFVLASALLRRVLHPAVSDGHL